MKLSKIIEKPNLKSVTISVLNPETVVCDLFIGGRKKPLKKVYKKLEVDIDIKETDNWTVKHLGIKKYFYLKNDDFYINLYYY
jgi:hypothetical protein